MKITNIFIVVLLLPSLAGFSGCIGTKETRREVADGLTREGRFREANKEYLRHIDERLRIADRPDWENPYIYYLDIGDNYLRQGKAEEALRYYFIADQKAVRPEYVTDRIRGVAQWYERRGEPRQAIRILRENRHRDELLFDMILDRISRRLVEEGQYEEVMLER